MGYPRDETPAVRVTATGRLADCLYQGATVVNYGRMSSEPCTVEPMPSSSAT